MPFEVKARMEQRIAFVVRADSGKEPMSSLGNEFGISQEAGNGKPVLKAT